MGLLILICEAYQFIGALAAFSLPVLALVNVLRFGKLNVTSEEYRSVKW